MEKRSGSFLERVAAVIVDKRNIVFFFYIVAAIFSAFSRNWVKVNDDLTVYLPDTTETRQGLDLMNREFTTFATAKVMVDNITYPQAQELCQEISDIKGVKSVDFDDSEKHYSSAAALFSVTFDGLEEDEISIEAFQAIQEKLAGYDLYVNSQVGNPLKAIIAQEMLVVDIIAVVIVVVVLLFTSQTYAEIVVLLVTFGSAAVLNMGTNFLMGEISFVTDSIAIVLQLALAVDYAIILLHRYAEEHEDKPAREAIIIAWVKAVPEISASSLTTISGLFALCLMQFTLGRDMGVVLIKAILLSMLSVFLLMPGILMLFSRLIDNTHHKNFVPRIDFLGRAVYATRYVMPVLFAVTVALAFMFSHRANYVYSQDSISSIRKNESQLAMERIKEVFGTTEQLALIVPSGDYESERKLIENIQELSCVDSVLGLANVEAMDGYKLTDALTPRQFSELTELDIEIAKTLYAGYALNLNDYGQVATNLENYKVPLIDMFEYLLEKKSEVTIDLPPDTEETLDSLALQLRDAKLQLKSGSYSRIVIELDLPVEGHDSFAYLDILHGLSARYYDEYYVVGNTTSCKDLSDSFKNDNLLISILTVAFVIAVLIFTFKSVGLPLLLILIIQGSIWCNFSSPYLNDTNLFFITYLIISAIQMGANIDYAIVISSRYMELKEQMPLKEAMINTLNMAFPTIITSGTMLASAGIVIGFLCSNETISSIGMFLGIGTLISIFLVMFVLPQILLLGDIIIEKTSFTIGGNLVTRRVGVMRINGRVRGNINGLVDAEIHGIFRGELNAVIDVGNVQELSDDLLENNNGGEEK